MDETLGRLRGRPGLEDGLAFSLPRTRVIYFSVTTLTTVGFGDLAPQTALGKLCTVLYIFVGLGIVGGFIHSLAKESWSTGGGRQSRGESREDASGG
jgi:hypothetical protein